MNETLWIKGVTVQVRVSEYPTGREWYTKLLGREPDFHPHEGFEGRRGFCEWRLLSAAECWLQVAEGEPARSSGPIRLGVDDIEAEVERLSEMIGFDPPEIGQTPDGQVRFCTFEDPWGNRIGLFQDDSASAKS